MASEIVWNGNLRAAVADHSRVPLSFPRRRESMSSVIPAKEGSFVKLAVFSLNSYNTDVPLTHSHMISKKGFTLFEILLVIAIMAIIAIAALTSTVNTQKQFVFVNTHKELLAKIREARLYNVTQKSVELGGSLGLGIPSAYGVNISWNDSKIVTTVFGDLAEGGNVNRFDDNEIIGPSHSFDATKYTLTLKTSQADIAFNNANTSLTILYQPGTLKAVALYTTDDWQTSELLNDPYIKLELKDSTSEALKKNIVIFTRSGMAEEIRDLDKLPQQQ
ncbi:MAG: prepilin-type N-terminal cleavage/methylation domain-containing protein [Candidatus Gracilibacteria bacterium]|nr:prepilin-type N-terminal cleavage/methylation domain-containing protein [Candidatus Gracilibacteria bacterium]